MAGAVQAWVAERTEKQMTDFIGVVENIPEEKRTWSPKEGTRSTLDQAAECAILAGRVADLLTTRVFNMEGGMEKFFAEKNALAESWPETKALLEANVPKLVSAVMAIPDEDLSVSIDMPWGARTISEILYYPMWNLGYHEGQVNYIASILGCLK